MAPEKANSTIKVAALVVGGVYLYRRFTEPTAVEHGGHQVAPLGRWLVGWGVVFFSLSVMATYWPGLAGELAILIMLTTIITNGAQVTSDLNKGLGKGPREPTIKERNEHAGRPTSPAIDTEKPIPEPRSA